MIPCTCNMQHTTYNDEVRNRVRLMTSTICRTSCAERSSADWTAWQWPTVTEGATQPKRKPIPQSQHWTGPALPNRAHRAAPHARRQTGWV